VFNEENSTTKTLATSNAAEDSAIPFIVTDEYAY